MGAMSDLDVPDHWNCLCHVAVLPVSAAMILGSMDAISDLDVVDSCTASVSVLALMSALLCFLCHL